MANATSNKTPASVVAKMVTFYGSIEAARAAYKALNVGLKTQLGECLVCRYNGEIQKVYASMIFYAGSMDAYGTYLF